MQSANQFIEDFLIKQAHFFQVAGPLSCGLGERAEAVLEATESLTGAAVTTSGSGPGYRQKFILERKRDSWKIKEVQSECTACFIRAQLAGNANNESCEDCGGAGWCPQG